MIILAIGITIFFGIHLVPSFVAFRHRIITRIGEGPYQGLFSVISLSGFILIIYGKFKAGFQPIWEPPLWSIKVSALLMLLSLVLLASAYMKSNIKRYSPHPMLWAVALWSAAHLFTNGDLASLLLFGSFALFSLFDMVSANLRGATKQQIKYPYTKDIVAIVAGVVAYGIFLFLHPYLFGVSII